MATTSAGGEVSAPRAGWVVRGWDASEVLGVALITLVAFALRAVCLDQSLFGDELFAYEILHDRSLGEVFSVVHDTEKTPPLGFVLAWLPERLGGPELIRLPSFVAGVATVPLLYLLGRRIFGRPAALVAALWFAVSPFQIFYGTETRSYAVVAALVVLSTLALLAAIDERRVRWWALYVVAAAAALYTHYIAALTLIPQAAWALWVHKEVAREQLISNGIVVAAFLPWAPSFLVQFDHSSTEAEYLSTVAPLTASYLAEISGKALVGHPFVSLADLPGASSLAVIGVVLVLATAALIYDTLSGRRVFRPAITGRPALAAGLALIPLIGLALYSARPNTSFLLARNLSVAVPYALLIIGWLLTRPCGQLRWLLPVAALAALVVGTVKMVTPAYQRPDGRDAAQYIDAHAGPRASVVDAQVIAEFDRPPARATRIYLKRHHRIYPGARWVEAWQDADRRGGRVLVSFPRTGVVKLLVPPPPFAARYRLVAEQTTKGAPFGMAVREYVPR